MENKAEKRFYVDACVWRDYFENRGDGIRPLGEFAFGFLSKCSDKKCLIVYSELTLLELKDFDGKMREVISEFGNKMLEVPVLGKEVEEAVKISKERKLPTNDAIHSLIARDNGAIIITRDFHFQELLDIAEAKAPEEAILD